MREASTILIVDDDPIAREALEALLSSKGYRMVSAANGFEGLARAAEYTPDAVLLDVMMPGMNGFEVCKRLRADARLAEVPIIMITALDDRDARLLGLRTGADDFVAKPFDSLELEVRLQTITRLNRFRRLMTEHARFEWLVEHSEEGYLILNELDEIQYANPKAQLYLGLLQYGDASLGQDFLDLVRRRYRCQPLDAWQIWPESPSQPVTRYLVQPETATARAAWLQVEVPDLPLVAGMGRVICLRDVTAQQALQQDIYSFHSLVSHKLVTPLNPLLAGLELLKIEARTWANAEVNEWIDAALRGANSLRDHLMNIFAYLDLPALAQVGEGCPLAQLEPMIARQGAEIGLESVSVTIPASLQATRLALSVEGMELALREILENAKKFHPQRTPTVEVTVSQTGDADICLQIFDDGLTLSLEQLVQVWTPYFQAEKAFTGQVRGMGLGLPLVASLVWNVGGTSRLYNRTDRAGVVVELTLPLERCTG
jgi:two-component system cell cycle response regulator